MNTIAGESLTDGFRKEEYKSTKVKLNKDGQSAVLKFVAISPQIGMPQFIARKAIQINPFDENNSREYKILKSCKHDNILQLFGWEIVYYVDLEIEYLYLYTELGDGNLRTLITDNTELTIQDVKSLAMQLSNGLAYLHKKGVVHRDIKPENILVYNVVTLRNAILKYGDFGLSRLMPISSSASTAQYTACGTRDYASPEMILAMDNNSYTKFPTDIFSLGVLIFDIITGKRPFTQMELRQEHNVETVVKDKRSYIKHPYLFSEVVETDCGIGQGLIGMLQWEPKHRLQVDQLHCFFNSSMNVVEAKVPMICKFNIETNKPLESSGSEDKSSRFESLLEGFLPEFYEQESQIASGQYDIVFRYVLNNKVVKTNLPKRVALKNIPLKHIEGDEANRDYDILKKCDHENVLKLYFWKIVQNQIDAYLYLYTELCDCNLRHFWSEHSLDIVEIKQSIKQMMQGLGCLHFNNIVHRDIKPENILIVYENVGKPSNIIIKLADCERARFMPAGMISCFEYSCVCTRSYSSPEVIQAIIQSKPIKSERLFATDIFSLGVVIFEMITDKLPFTESDLQKPSFNVDIVIRNHIFDPKLSECLSQMLQWDSRMRKDVGNIMQFLERE